MLILLGPVKNVLFKKNNKIKLNIKIAVSDNRISLKLHFEFYYHCFMEFLHVLRDF